MPHATHKARRILTSEPARVPLRRRRSRLEQQLQLGVAVGFTTLVIASFYVATFTSRLPAQGFAFDAPRWSLLDEDLLDRAKPVYQDLTGVKASLLRLTSTGKTQSEAALILKAKIEARAAASGTPETSETPETP